MVVKGQDVLMVFNVVLSISTEQISRVCYIDENRFMSMPNMPYLKIKLWIIKIRTLLVEMSDRDTIYACG
jgi:hypothetical protein